MTNLFPRLLCLAFAVVLLAPRLVAAQAPSELEARRKALNDLLAEQWEYQMRTNPVYASMLGDKRWNDKLNDFSEAFIERDLQQTQNFLSRFEAIDTTGFPDQEALNKTLMVRDLKTQLADAHFKPWEMPVTQVGGIHIDTPQLVSVLSFESVKDYDGYIARLKALPVLFGQTEIQMRKGMADRLMPPRRADARGGEPARL